MKNLFNIDENEKQRILESHIFSSKKQYLNLLEQSNPEKGKCNRGDCKNGEGELWITENGYTYIYKGDFKNGKLEGDGSLRVWDMAFKNFYGELSIKFVNGLESGKGKISSENLDYDEFDITFENGKTKNPIDYKKWGSITDANEAKKYIKYLMGKGKGKNPDLPSSEEQKSEDESENENTTVKTTMSPDEEIENSQEYLTENLPEFAFFTYVKGKKTVKIYFEEGGIYFDNTNKIGLYGYFDEDVMAFNNNPPENKKILVIIDCNEYKFFNTAEPKAYVGEYGTITDLIVEITYPSYPKRGMSGWDATTSDRDFIKVIQNSNFCYAGRKKTNVFGKPKYKSPN